MIYILLLGFSFFFIFNLYSNMDADMNEASRYIEAGDYDQGKEIYERLIKSTEETWKKMILKYNLATANLEEGNSETAIFEYKGLLNIENLPSFILTKIYSNLAIAYWRSIEKRKLNIKNIDLLTTSYISIITNLEKALEAISLAEAAQCDQILDEGGEYCKREENLFLLRSAIQNKMTFIKVQFQKQQIEILSVKEALPIILTLVETLKDYLQEIVELPKNSEILKQQINRIQFQLDSWNNLWNLLNNKVKDHSIFVLFEKEFKNIIQRINQKEIYAAIDDLNVIKSNIKKNIKELYVKSSFAKLFKDLMMNYKRIATSFTLNPQELLSLIEFQEIIEDILRNRNIQTSSLEEARNYLNLSIKNWQKQNLELSKLYFFMAYKKTLRNLFELKNEVPTKKTIALFLKYLIKEQKINENIYLISSKVKENETFEDSNKETIKFAKNFWKMISIVQKENFVTECQFNPWHEVIPLFENGLNYAIDFDYERSINEWKKALNKLLNPSDVKNFCEPKPPSPVNNESNDSNKQKTNSSSWSSGSINDVLSLLQTMDKQDRQEKKNSEGIVQERLW